MKFETVKELDDEKFRRLAVVKRITFNKMVLILEQSNSRITRGINWSCIRPQRKILYLIILQDLYIEID